jgi:hypothetical protein
MIRVGVWIYTNPAKGIEIETARLYPINEGDMTEDMKAQLRELAKQAYEPSKK